MLTKIIKCIILFFAVLNLTVVAQKKEIVTTGPLVSFKKTAGSFPLATKGISAVLYTDKKDQEGVRRAFNDLKADIGLVTGINPEITSEKINSKHIVIAGTIGENTVIDALIRSKKLNVDGIKDTWENHIIQVIKNPFPGTEDALVIAGSDKRGTIFGIYTLSENIGVSPWNWWADVPVINHKDIYVNQGIFTPGPPAVKYRGIFLNDEAPALSGWANKEFGGFKHGFYAKVFELILRLKGNYLWPAMWGSAFYDDDPKSAPLADQYGIVIGTSHHEPLMRAHDEWRRYGKGDWNYKTNPQVLQSFWREGIRRMGNNESILSVGMRGDGDEPMTEESNISLLEGIVNDQRNIIKSVSGRDPSEIPQLWALYKEVQDYYDKGMRVPDDVTLLLCDDNWGNNRKLPVLNSPLRKGGYGIYYHFDYVGGPRNYKWVNTNPITKVWEQMHLAYEYNARQIWIVNVGDLKPMEFPISFFLEYAWNPDKWPAEKLNEFTLTWVKKQFGDKYAVEISEIISAYTKYNGRRKHELLDENTYSLTNNLEFENVVNEYKQLNDKAATIGKKLEKKYSDAYYQLVLHPVQASANLNELYLAVAKNKLYAKQKRSSTGDEADKARKFYDIDAKITNYYNDTLAKGKWKHMMDQTHIGYTYWQQPPVNKIPDLKTSSPLDKPQMAVSIQGSSEVWPGSTSKPILPELNKYSNKKYYIEIFNQGTGKFNYTAETIIPWVKVSSSKGSVLKETRLWINVDWKKAPPGDHLIPITVKSDHNLQAEIYLNIKDYGPNLKGFIPDGQVLSIEASHFSSKKSFETASWKILPDYGRTLSAVTPMPVTAITQTPGTDNCPVLEYQINILNEGKIKIASYLAPSLDIQNTGGLKFAISIDDEKPQIININADKKLSTWNKNVADNINILYTIHVIKSPGAHTLKIWMVDPAVVLQKLVISPEEYIENTYLGPPESTIAR